ncbi:MAG: TetR/AcrR family transcriptional regulator [Clostridiales bacterium]|nr:TetR/AcrR family transcriptional regulator [Clostridiales bacterium]
MAIAFTQEQKDEIQEKLIEAGFELSTSIGFKKMTVATVAKSAGVAVGSFYIFFDSKENFVLALIKEAEKEAELRMATVFEKDGTIPLKKFLSVFRENFRPETNFLLKIRLDDWVWLKSHLTDTTYFNTSSDRQKIEYLLPRIKGVREDIDPGVVVNFIKSIYALYQNRETLFEESLETNVDLIFDSIYRYLKA